MTRKPWCGRHLAVGAGAVLADSHRPQRDDAVAGLHFPDLADMELSGTAIAVDQYRTHIRSLDSDFDCVR